MFLLSKVTVPLVGLYKPVKTLKKVVFPAPFGPIKETTPPVGISNETSSTATKPTNLTEILSACNTGLVIINDFQYLMSNHLLHAEFVLVEIRVIDLHAYKAS